MPTFSKPTSTSQNKGIKNEKRSLVRYQHSDCNCGSPGCFHAGPRRCYQWSSGLVDAGADCSHHHAWLSHCIHADGNGRDIYAVCLSCHGSKLAIEQTLDLMVLRTYAVMTNDVLIAVPLFIFMGYLVERANLIEKLFKSLHLV